MDDTTAASAGFVLAGVATAASLLDWPYHEVAVGLAAVALVAFALRRYGRLDRVPAAAAAIVGCAGATAVGLRGTFLSAAPPGAVLVAAAGGAGAVAAYADLRGLDREALAVKGQATVVGAVIGGLGIVALVAWAIVFGLLGAAFLPGGTGVLTRTVLSTLATGVGTLTVVVLYLRSTDRDTSFLDLRAPDVRGLGYAAGGAVAILGGSLSIALAFQYVGVESASHTIVRTAEADPRVLLVLVPLSYLVVAPGEELLYRNVVQKTLRESFSPVAGVVVASAIFAAVHVTAYWSPEQGLLATGSTLAVIFVLALVLGGIYERTGNVVVPILAHGTYNAVGFALTYAQYTGQFAG